jgi:hypothetical protein
MQLRNDARLIFRSKPIWPPRWKTHFGAQIRTPSGEVGVLLDVKTSVMSHPFPIWLVISYQGDKFMSEPLLFEEFDEYFHFLEIFKGHLGRPVSTLGSIESDW